VAGFQDKEYLIVDEFSMLGGTVEGGGWVDDRLKDLDDRLKDYISLRAD